MNNIMQIVIDEINAINDGKYKDLLALNQTQAAKALGVSASTLEKHRTEAVGPKWKKLGKDDNKKGRIIYPKWAIAEYLIDTVKTV